MESETAFNRRVRRWVLLALRSCSLPLTLVSIKHHASAPVLSALRRGAEIELKGSTFTFRYRAKTFDLPTTALGITGPLADMLDARYAIYPVQDDTWRLDIPDGPSFVLDRRSLSSDLAVIWGRFVEHEYDSFDVSGHIVLDIGANIGDSAVYFALHGAKAIYGFEPFRDTFSRACANVTLNQMEDRVKLFNVGIASREEERTAVYEPSNAVGLTIPSDLLGEPARDPATRYEHIRMIPFSRAVSMCDAFDGDRIACKMDCEGSEFEIFTHDPGIHEALSKIDKMLIEYHWESPSRIVEVLRSAGFAVEAREVARKVGFINAVRRR